MKHRYAPFTTLSIAERLELSERAVFAAQTIVEALKCDCGRLPTITLQKKEPDAEEVRAALSFSKKHSHDITASVCGLLPSSPLPEPFDTNFPPPQKPVKKL